ncbi:MAG: serine hydrolase domain-containing protein [Pseudomonadota bacterium]
MNWTRYFVTLTSLVLALGVVVLYPFDEDAAGNAMPEPDQATEEVDPLQAGAPRASNIAGDGPPSAAGAVMVETRVAPDPEFLEDSEGLDFASYRNWLRGEMNEEEIPGVAMAIVSSRGILDLRTWGVRSVKTRQPVGPETVFRIASVSKTFAGTVASQLVAEDGQSWDQPIMQILPQYTIGTKPSSRDITLRHVMSHSTGLMPHAYSNMLDAGVAYERIREKFHEIPTVCPPGRCYGYQNVVFSLIADIVEQQAHTSYEDYVRQRIFRPLGMTGASMTMEEFQADDNASAPHRYGRGGWYESTINPAYFSVGPASGINASVMDMVRWTRANLGAHPEVLPTDLLEMQQTPVVETPHGSYFNRWPGVENAWYGVGWRIFDYEGVRVVHHGGGVRGFRTEMALLPELDIGIVVLFNAETRVANDVVPNFMESVLSQHTPAPETLVRSD